MIGDLQWKQRSVNGYGEETGRYWDAGTETIGYEGDDYIAVKDLARRLAWAGPLKDRASERFLIDAIFAWLQEMSSGKGSIALTDFIAKQASALEAQLAKTSSTSKEGAELQLKLIDLYDAQGNSKGQCMFTPGDNAVGRVDCPGLAPR